MSVTSQVLLELQGVSKRFVKPLDVIDRLSNLLGAGLRDEVVHAVDQVDLTVRQGEIVALVGESGCGKSTLGRLVAGLHTLSKGSRRWRGVDYSRPDARLAPGQILPIQMIFQDPYASINPRMRVLDIIGEAPVAHRLIQPHEQPEWVASLLQQVGLDASVLARFPHQFSGGQRARIGIARALAVRPEFLVCDEAVAALDVSIQAQVLKLFLRLREQLGLTYLFISHDLGVVRYLSDRVVIMYLGRVVETAQADELFRRPNHPYTHGLLQAEPGLEARKRRFVPIKGEIPSPLHPPDGCHFHPRCSHARDICRQQAPALREISPGHVSACHLNG